VIRWRVLLILSSAVLILSVAVLLWCHHWLHQPMVFESPHEDGVTVKIGPGDTLSKVAYSLASNGVLLHPKILTLYARFTQQTRVNIGEYRVQTQMSPVDLLALLQSDAVIEYTVTFVEGKTFKEFLAALANEPKITHTFAGKSIAEVMADLGLSISHPEGWFFPDTYFYTEGTTDKAILIRAHRRMQQVLESQWQQRAPKGLPYNSAYKALIMASIVEKETGDPSERAQIAGVFVRRLQKGMRLQTDPTVIYGLGERYKGNIRRRHLSEPTPYNTYVINGLPPTPIAMPGEDAIHAALHPAPGSALFFVAKGNGSHYFSATLAEHNKAVRRYQIEKRSSNYRSAPASR